MGKILDLLAEQKSKQRYITSKSDARDYFVQQKSSLDAISETPGYKEIISYWKRVADASIQRLRTTTKSELKEVQETLNLAMDFIDFIDNIKNSTIQPDEDF